MIKIILSVLFFTNVCFAGLPPTTSRVSGDSSNVTTFNFQFPNFTGTHTGTTLSLGVNNIAGGGTNNGSLGVTAGGIIFTDGSKLVNTGAGSNGQALISNGAGAPTWGNVLTNPLTTTGDIIYGVGSTPTRLAAGTSGYILQTLGNTLAPAWIALSSIASSITTNASAPQRIERASIQPIASGNCALNNTGTGMVGSLSGNAAGDCTITFAQAWPTVDYQCSIEQINANTPTSNIFGTSIHTKTTTTMRFISNYVATGTTTVVGNTAPADVICYGSR